MLPGVCCARVNAFPECPPREESRFLPREEMLSEPNLSNPEISTTPPPFLKASPTSGKTTSMLVLLDPEAHVKPVRRTDARDSSPM